MQLPFFLYAVAPLIHFQEMLLGKLVKTADEFVIVATFFYEVTLQEALNFESVIFSSFSYTTKLLSSLSGLTKRFSDVMLSLQRRENEA
jgi:hypothetical protein